MKLNENSILILYILTGLSVLRQIYDAEAARAESLDEVIVVLDVALVRIDEPLLRHDELTLHFDF